MVVESNFKIVPVNFFLPKNARSSKKNLVDIARQKMEKNFTLFHYFFAIVESNFKILPVKFC